jgi:hypothetical protein
MSLLLLFHYFRSLNAKHRLPSAQEAAAMSECGAGAVPASEEFRSPSYYNSLGKQIAAASHIFSSLVNDGEDRPQIACQRLWR